MTVRECLAKGRRLLAGKASGALEAELLLAYALGWERLRLVTHAQEELPEPVAAQYRALVQRRQEGEPLAYLVGEKEFMSLPFSVSPGVLIPRPDTETLVEAVLRWCRGREVRILDACTGSGCIAVSLACYLKEAHVTAIDCSPVCVQTAAKNAERNGVSARVKVHQGDLLTSVPSGGPYDCFVSNPPYIRPEVIAQLAPDVRDYEPTLALDGGVDGLRFYRRIAALAETLLKPGGLLAVEIGFDQRTPVEAVFRSCQWLTAVETERDLADNDRVVRAIRREA